MEFCIFTSYFAELRQRDFYMDWFQSRKRSAETLSHKDIKKGNLKQVPSFIHDWCAQHDLNMWPPPSHCGGRKFETCIAHHFCQSSKISTT